MVLMLYLNIRQTVVEVSANSMNKQKRNSDEQRKAGDGKSCALNLTLIRGHNHIAHKASPRPKEHERRSYRCCQNDA